MSPTMPTTWRVLRSQQDMARKNARQALLVIQQRRRELAEAELALPALVPSHGTVKDRPPSRADPAQRTRSTRRSSHTGSADS